MKYLILLFLSTQIIHAEDFVIKHPTCSAKYVNNPSHNTSFQKLIVQLIKDRQYKLTVSTKRAKILEGDLYFMVDLVRSKSMLYKDCSVKVSLKSAKARHMSSRDKILASKEIENYSKSNLNDTFKNLHDAIHQLENFISTSDA